MFDSSFVKLKKKRKGFGPSDSSSELSYSDSSDDSAVSVLESWMLVSVVLFSDMVMYESSFSCVCSLMMMKMMIKLSINDFYWN